MPQAKPLTSSSSNQTDVSASAEDDDDGYQNYKSAIFHKISKDKERTQAPQHKEALPKTQA